MASIFTHAFVAAAMGKVYTAEARPARFWFLSMLCAVLPDADVLAFAFGVPYGDPFGHRGFTHSLAFALLVAVAVVALLFKRSTPSKTSFVFYFFLATASHGALDALTNGGLGVAFFSPFSNARHFFPFRPVEVSPIGVASFFSEWGLAVVISELLWVWTPAALVVAAVLIFRRRRRGGGGEAQSA